MKNKLTHQVAAVGLIMILALAGSAAAYGAVGRTAQEAANHLYELGLVKGVVVRAGQTPDFHLTGKLTRSEAVAMLVRLLGKEEEALQGTWSMPFTDVESWAKPYVGYAYNHSLINGTSAAAYEGSLEVSATEYLTLLLRALGYVSGVDFQWNQAWKLSDRLGLTHGEYSVRPAFTRGDAMVLSDAVLTINKKDSAETLLMSVGNQVQIGSSYGSRYIKIKNYLYSVPALSSVISPATANTFTVYLTGGVVSGYPIRHNGSEDIYISAGGDQLLYLLAVAADSYRIDGKTIRMLGDAEREKPSPLGKNGEIGEITTIDCYNYLHKSWTEVADNSKIDHREVTLKDYWGNSSQMVQLSPSPGRQKGIEKDRIYYQGTVRCWYDGWRTDLVNVNDMLAYMHIPKRLTYHPSEDGKSYWEFVPIEEQTKQ